ncbi:MAG: hypothetical protein BWY67_01595 [Bacteroidetes bacterium ADurb.Bin397]|nr:MAG: hypothetical protein BWY67_01595 [Bacteroidetes bacterium ADurb.Bin397]
MTNDLHPPLITYDLLPSADESPLSLMTNDLHPPLITYDL